MDLLKILQIAAAIGTILTGLFALIKPGVVQGFTGLTAVGGRGVTEIRAIFGGLFIALGLAPLVFANSGSYQLLGIAYGGIGAVRAVSMLVDRSIDKTNVTSMVVEIVFAVLLVL